MSWRDRLLSASFRGAAFHVRQHSETGGRRLVVHEYPGEEEPFTEDLGRRAGGWQVEGYIVGGDYHAARDGLRRACNASGPGTLVHPYLGTLRVACDQVTVSERSDEGRVARFSMRFVEAGRNRYPAARTDTGAAVASAVQSARSASQGALVDGWLQ